MEGNPGPCTCVINDAVAISRLNAMIRAFEAVHFCHDEFHTILAD